MHSISHCVDIGKWFLLQFFFYTSDSLIPSNYKIDLHKINWLFVYFKRHFFSHFSSSHSVCTVPLPIHFFSFCHQPIHIIKKFELTAFSVYCIHSAPFTGFFYLYLIWLCLHFHTQSLVYLSHWLVILIAISANVFNVVSSVLSISVFYTKFPRCFLLVSLCRKLQYKRSTGCWNNWKRLWNGKLFL